VFAPSLRPRRTALCRHIVSLLDAEATLQSVHPSARPSVCLFHVLAQNGALHGYGYYRTLIGIPYGKSNSPVSRGVARSKNVGWVRVRACGARAYNGAMRAEPPAGSRGRAPGQEVRDKASIPRTTSGKSGVDVSTPVHPVATPLPVICGRSATRSDRNGNEVSSASLQKHSLGGCALDTPPSSRMHHVCGVVCLCRCVQFSQLTRDGEVYHDYCLNYSKAMTYLEQLRKNDEFVEFEKVRPSIILPYVNNSRCPLFLQLIIHVCVSVPTKDVPIKYRFLNYNFFGPDCNFRTM